MGMLDLYNEEQARDALEDAKNTKKELMEQVDELDAMIFILKYFLNTGDALDPGALGIKDPEEEDNLDE